MSLSETSCEDSVTRDLEAEEGSNLYENNNEKYSAGGRDPRSSAKQEDGHRWIGRRWTGEEDRVKEWQEILHKENQRKSQIGKQSIMATENPSQESSKVINAPIRSGSPSASTSGANQNPQEVNRYGKETLYENMIAENGNGEETSAVKQKTQKNCVSPTKDKSGSLSSLKSSGSEGKVVKKSKAHAIRKSLFGGRGSSKSVTSVEGLEKEKREKQKRIDIEFEKKQKERDDRIGRSIKEKIAYNEGKATSK